MPAAFTLELKQRLYDTCLRLVANKINHEISIMEQAQAAANLETKSSAGDKYETGRALTGKGPGDVVEFRGNRYQVLGCI